jgi:hypothetical protein
MFADSYSRPQWDQRAVEPAPVAQPSLYERVTLGHVLAFLAGMIVGMVVMRWQHRG